jgi:mannose-6-phosphate isomerase-like protein (cupin superfamily)
MRTIGLIVALVLGIPATAQTSTGDHAPRRHLPIDSCVNEFSPSGIESTRVGYQYWFVNRDFLDGRTLKLSVVRPHEETHPPHIHPEDEFFFVLEGTAEFILDGETRTVHPYASCYAPPNVLHGIRNVGSDTLKYLVLKKYPSR